MPHDMRDYVLGLKRRLERVMHVTAALDGTRHDPFQLAEKDEHLKIQQQMITHLRAVIEYVLPRYAEIYEQSGLGHPNTSIAVQEMRRALDTTKHVDVRGYGELRALREALDEALEQMKSP
jgi:hypothetical protein